MAVIQMEGFERQQWMQMNPSITVKAASRGEGVVAPATDYGFHLLVRSSAQSGGGQSTYTLGQGGIGDWGNLFVFGIRFLRYVARTHTIVSIFNSDEAGATGASILDFGITTAGVPTINGVETNTGILVEDNVEYFLEIEVDKVSLEARVRLTNQLVGTAPITGDETYIGYSFGTSSILANSNFQNFLWFDDLYVLDGNGTTNTSRLGRVKVVERLPQTDAVAEFNRDSGASNAEMVADTGPLASDSTYVYSNQAGATDLYQNADPLPFDAPVLAMSVSVAARKAGADARAVAPMIQSGSADEVGGRVELLNNTIRVGVSMFNVDPATGEPWTQASAAAAKFGQTLVV